MSRILTNTALLIIGCIAFPIGLFILMTGATGPQDTIENSVTSITVFICGFVVLALSVLSLIFPIGAICRFASAMWDRQVMGRRT